MSFAKASQVSKPQLIIGELLNVDLGGKTLAGSPADFGKLIADETDK
jgi:hypothetical protein